MKCGVHTQAFTCVLLFVFHMFNKRKAWRLNLCPSAGRGPYCITVCNKSMAFPVGPIFMYCTLLTTGLLSRAAPSFHLVHQILKTRLQRGLLPKETSDPSQPASKVGLEHVGANLTHLYTLVTARKYTLVTAKRTSPRAKLS